MFVSSILQFKENMQRSIQIFSTNFKEEIKRTMKHGIRIK